MGLANVYSGWSIAPMVLISLTGCAHLGWPIVDGHGFQPVLLAMDTLTIAAIKQSPSVNTIVQVKGRVANRAPLLGKTAYELQDGTGSIWVLTTDAAPNPGDTVVIQGKLLYQSISPDGSSGSPGESIYIEQQRQLQHSPALKS